MKKYYDVYEEGVRINDYPSTLETAENWQEMCNYLAIKCEIMEAKNRYDVIIKADDDELIEFNNFPVDIDVANEMHKGLRDEGKDVYIKEISVEEVLRR